MYWTLVYFKKNEQVSFVFCVLESSNWTPETEKLLVEMHTNLEQSKEPVKNKWVVVAEKMNTLYGYSFTSNQCRLKIKCIKEKLNRRKKKENTSGESPAESEDDDDDEICKILEKMPDIKPKATIDTDKITKATGTPSSVKKKKRKAEKKRTEEDSSSSDLEEPEPKKKGNLLLNQLGHL